VSSQYVYKGDSGDVGAQRVERRVREREGERERATDRLARRIRFAYTSDTTQQHRQESDTDTHMAYDVIKSLIDTH
jgi:hypothetical protein